MLKVLGYDNAGIWHFKEDCDVISGTLTMKTLEKGWYPYPACFHCGLDGTPKELV